MTVYITYNFAGDRVNGSDFTVVPCADEAEATERLKLWVQQLDLDDGVKFRGIECANFGDCLFKVHSEPTSDDIARWAQEIGFPAEELTVTPPGQHPDGRSWWVGTNSDVFVAQIA